MQLDVFNVEHGACALLTCDDGKRLMFDCGHNGTTGWKPGSYLRSIGVYSITALFITNYDEDHVSGIRNLFENVTVPVIFRNMSVPPATIAHLKTEDGMGPGIEFLVDTITSWQKTGTTVGSADLGLSNVQVNMFCNSLSEFDDENNLSMLVELKALGTKFIFTGDLEKSGWLRLISRTDVQQALGLTDVFFASHHGRENGCCDDVFKHCKPRFVVISDKVKGYQTQETTNYYLDRARGGTFRGNSSRYVLTTRSDGNMRFRMFANNTFVAE
jgi:beta-lactamase superfamily II metal-dependent hydrolase